MLRTQQEWDDLSHEERLVLLAIAFELTKGIGLAVRFTAAQLSSGMSPFAFMHVLVGLEELELVQLKRNEEMGDAVIILTGHAITGELIPQEKFKQAQEEEFQRRKLCVR